MGRPLKKLPRKQITNQIKRIRTRNNKLWMLLFDLAVASKPRKAKKIIQQIVANDMQVSRWMSRI